MSPVVGRSSTNRRGTTTLIGVATALVVVGLLAVFAFELADTQAKSKDDVRSRVHERATLAAALIESLFESSAQQAPRNARRYGGRAVPDRVAERDRRTSAYVVLLDPSLRVLARSQGFTSQARRGLAASAATVRMVRAGRPYGLGDVVPYGRTGVINFAVPVRTRYGTRLLVTGFPPSALSQFIVRELRRIPGVRGRQSYLIDGRRRVIASTNPARPTGYVFRRPAQVRALARPSGETNGRYYDQVPLAGSTWRLVLAAPEKALFANVSGLRKWVPWAIFAAFAAVTAAAFVLARRMLRSAAEARRAGALLAVTNRELARRAAELARSNDELDQFASIASHDLQEPLRKVRTFTQRLTVMEAEQLSEKGRDYLERTNAAAERMQRLIEDLLRFSRVATQARPFAPVDLGGLTAGVLEDLSESVARYDADVHVGPLPTVSGDAVQLRQLMQNLISNALKFRREGVPPVVRVDAQVEDDTVVLTVEDNGVGFDPQYEERIFRVFERLHGRSSQYPGTGIGLALCRKIAERHGGRIRGEGRPGEGARFVVTLPLHQEHETIVLADRPHDEDRTRLPEGPVHA
ncbi:MAG: two-component sensor histidine kinase [Solirubrobacterales bacterium]|nr:two-component sensor histidine kinase [Solirubrobacterales bacterium]